MEISHIILSAGTFSQGEPRVLGLAMIPGHHVVSIEVEADSLEDAPGFGSSHWSSNDTKLWTFFCCFTSTAANKELPCHSGFSSSSFLEIFGHLCHDILKYTAGFEQKHWLWVQLFFWIFCMCYKLCCMSGVTGLLKGNPTEFKTMLHCGKITKTFQKNKTLKKIIWSLKLIIFGWTSTIYLWAAGGAVPPLPSAHLTPRNCDNVIFLVF